jgi:hypothetical protein
MSGHPPSWVPFDAGSPPELPGGTPGATRVVALVATPRAVSSGWPGEVARALARAWSSRGARVVLADAGLAVPTLHEVFGVDNEEGLADVLLRGAPIGRVTRPVPEDGFHLISGGAPIAQGAGAFAGGRWRRLCARFRAAGVTVVALVPQGEPGWASVVSAATDVLILSEPSDDLTDAREVAGERARAVVGPGPDEDAGPSGVPDAATSGLRDAAPAGRRDAGAGSEPAARIESGAEAARVRTQPSNRPKGGARAWAIAGVGITGILIAVALLGPIDFRGSAASPAGEATPAAVAAPPAGSPLPTPTPPVAEVAPLMEFSVALGSYRNGGSAARRARVVGGLLPGVVVLSVPVEIGGAVYHRVLAGPARDSADAARLAGEIARRGGLDRSGWILRATPRAFRLDEMGDPAAARERADAFTASGVPAYVLAVAYEDGSTRYRVYAGAYADEMEASYLAGLLRERGITTATLSDRTGRPPE